MDFEVVVIGAGVVGLAISKILSENKLNTLIIEKNKIFGQETSSRNSGVIHAGIYYENNSLKAKLCVEGNKLLYEYLKIKNIKFNRCGKIIVSTNKSEDQKLKQMQINAKKNNVNVFLLDKNETKKLEPAVNCYSSLLSPNTGVFDIHGLMQNFEIDIQNNNGTILYNNNVERIIPKKDWIEFKIKNDNRTYKTKLIINSSGLNSHILASKVVSIKQNSIPSVKLLKGNYFKMHGPSPFKTLVYPLPQKNSLGIHSTLNINNETIFGPDEEEVKEINYNVNEKKEVEFRKSISKYYPDIKTNKIFADYSGIRGVCNQKKKDFIIQTKETHGVKGLINLFNINSPGLTSSLAIANYILANIKNY